MMDSMFQPSLPPCSMHGHSTDVFLGNTEFGEVEGLDIELPQVSLVGVHVITRAVGEADTLTLPVVRYTRRKGESSDPAFLIPLVKAIT